MTSPLLKTFDCPGCGASVQLRANGLTLTVVCGSCHSAIDTHHPQFKILETYNRLKRIDPLIPFGTRGNLGEGVFEVIGFMRREDVASGWSWDEYLLFNPYKGFRFLIEDHGHWLYGKVVKAQPKNASQFKKFHSGHAKVTYVLGEFYWRVKVGEKVNVVDSIHPPYIHSLESTQSITGSERNWSLSEYLPAHVIRTAFRTSAPLPTPVGINPCQPNPYDRPGMMAKWGALAATLFAIQVFSQIFAPTKIIGVFDHTFAAGDSSAQTTPPFEVPGSIGNLSVRAEAKVFNSWIDLNYTLISTTDPNVVHSTGHDISYFYGSDSDGDWSEGGQVDTAFFSEVPGGTYTLSIDAEASQNLPQVQTQLTVARNRSNWSNFWLFFVLLGLGPLYFWLRSRSFETRRWANA